jgi:formylglycine-generating enzyme required for sulfatase activity
MGRRPRQHEFRGRKPLLGLLRAVALVAPLAGSCQIVGGYQDFSPAVDASVPSPCASLRAATPSKVLGTGNGEMTMLLVDNLAGSCFWIGAQEVSVAQYKAWLASLGGAPPSWRDPDYMDACSWKTPPDGGAPVTPFDPDSYAPSDCTIPANETDPFADDKPIRCVDWCEADIFCRQLQKGRLCYVGDTVQVLVPPGEPDEWAFACNGDNKLAYSFDPSSPSSVCNYNQAVAGCMQGLNGNACGPWPVSTGTECAPAPGYPINMGGNVAEWIDLCGKGAGPDVECNYRGGSYDSTLSEIACAAVNNAPRNQRSSTLGFRCCAGLTPQESGMVGR